MFRSSTRGGIGFLDANAATSTSSQTEIAAVAATNACVLRGLLRATAASAKNATNGITPR